MMLALLIGMSSWAFAQGTGEIWGKVIDAQTGLTIPGANVVIKTGNTMIGTQTDVDGNFKLKGLAPGTYNIEFSFVGYTSGELQKISVFADDYTRTEDFILTPGVGLPTVIIHGDKVIGVKPIPKMTFSDMQHISGKTDLKKMITLTSADITKTDDGQLYFRGARDGDYVYYVDGIKTNAEHFKIPSTAIGSIQVYTGGVPARYGDFTGGCVVIETQSYNDWLNSRN